jgi:sn-glycerol 3-phosphate transport system substrate-binding protein
VAATAAGTLTELSETPMAEEDSGKIVLDVWLNDWPLWPELTDVAREHAAEFGRKHPRYTVKIHPITMPTMPAEVAKAARAGAGPTIAAYQYTVTQNARDAVAADGTPLFTSVEKAVGGRTEILGEPVVLDDILTNARHYYTFDGELTSMPRNTSTILLHANLTLLEAAGIESVPKTWDELEAAGKALLALPGGPAHAVTWPNFGWFFQQSLGQQGGLLADHDNGRTGRAGKVDLASPEMLAYVQWWRRLHESGIYRYTGKPTDWPGTFAAFAAQEVAFLLSSSAETGRIVQAGQDGGFRVEAGPMPYNNRAPYYGNQVAGESLWLATGLDKSTEDGALAFLQYWTNARNAANRYEHGRSFVPTTEASIAFLESEGWFERNPHLRTAIDQLRTTTDTPATRAAVFGNFSEIQNLTAAAMHDVLTSGADPALRFAEATADAQALLNAYNAEHGPE